MEVFFVSSLHIKNEISFVFSFKYLPHMYALENELSDTLLIYLYYRIMLNWSIISGLVLHRQEIWVPT